MPIACSSRSSRSSSAVGASLVSSSAAKRSSQPVASCA